MARKHQEIKVVLHEPEMMDIKQMEMIDNFWIDMIIKKLEECNLTEEEWQRLAEYADR